MRQRPIFPILVALTEAEVEFVVVGGLAAVLNGAPLQTLDIDIVHARTPANVERLKKVLDDLDAVFRVQPERRMKPTIEYLSGGGHLNLTTKFGALDVLGTIGRGLGHEDLVADTEPVDIGDGVKIRVLKLGKLIELKEELGGEKDRAMLPLLRRTLEEKSRER
jgi:hypothetical protein